MRKMISLILVLSMFLSLAATASASGTSAPVVEMHGGIFAPDNSDVMPVGIYYSIPYIGPNVIVPIVTCQVTQGETYVQIEACGWYPMNQITIGFYDVNTLAQYGRTFSSTITNYTLTTENVPSGTYKLYIKNNGSYGIQSGYMEYNIYG